MIGGEVEIAVIPARVQALAGAAAMSAAGRAADARRQCRWRCSQAIAAPDSLRVNASQGLANRPETCRMVDWRAALRQALRD
jgi:hypothetical protein